MVTVFPQPQYSYKIYSYKEKKECRSHVGLWKLGLLQSGHAQCQFVFSSIFIDQPLHFFNLSLHYRTPFTLYSKITLHVTVDIPLPYWTAPTLLQNIPPHYRWYPSTLLNSFPIILQDIPPHYCKISLSPNNIENPPHYWWYPSRLLNILHITARYQHHRWYPSTLLQDKISLNITEQPSPLLQYIPLPYWTAPTLLQDIPPCWWWYAFTLLNILYNLRDIPPHYRWYPSTLLNTLPITARYPFLLLMILNSFTEQTPHNCKISI